MNYSFTAGWAGWFTGLSLIVLRVTTRSPQRIGLKVVVLTMAAMTGLLGYFDPRFGIPSVGLIGLVGGGVFATVYVNAQAGAFLETGLWHQMLSSLFRIPRTREFGERKARVEQRFLQARLMADLKLEADYGDFGAQFALCSMYQSANSFLHDPAEAYKWCLLAAAQGHREAASLRDQFSKFATPEQIAEGQRQAAQFVPKKDEDNDSPSPEKETAN